jgi:tetratricopeptide (TPR) repeat protein
MAEVLRSLDHLLQTIDMLLRIGHVGAAQQTIAVLTQQQPELQALQLFRGWAALQQGDPHRAVASFRLAAGRDPLDLVAWHGIAESSADVDERSAAADRAQLLNPEGPHAQLWHDLRSNKPHLAITPLHTLLRRFPERPELAIALAETQRRLGNALEARTLLEPLLRRRPRAVPALFLAAALTPDPMVGATYVADALRLDPLATIARRLFAPENVPFFVPAAPTIALPAELVAMLDALAPPQSAVRPSPNVRPIARVSAAKSTATPTPAPDDDRDASAALQAVEQASQRLWGRTPLANDPQQATALLVTHRGALSAAYGAETASAIIDMIEDYGASLAGRGIQGECVVLDDRGSLARVGNVLPVGEHTAAACKQVIDGVLAFLGSEGRDVDALVIFGGDGIVPFHRLPNPSQDADADVPSDNPYGCGGGSELAPELIVARFPDGGADGGDLLLDHLRRAIDYHHNWHLAGPQGGILTLPFMRRLTKPMQSGAPVVSWGVSAEAWQIPSQSVYNELGSTRPIVLCPPAGPDALEAAWPGDGRLLYFNLHGVSGGPNWYGQAAGDLGDAPLPIALTPDDIGPVASNLICVSEACFGAEIVSRNAADAMALRLLQRGALAFMGSTVTAYGSVALPLGGADLLVQQVFQNMRRGHPLGRAVVQARDWMAREMVERQGYLDPDDAKTLLSFVILGDPWATPYTRPVLKSKSALPQIRPVVVQRKPVASNLVAPAAVNTARQLIAKVAPQLARASLSVVGQGRPDRIAKGQASAVVFSAAGAVPTTDGRSLAQIARVTVAGGEARKVLLSR